MSQHDNETPKETEKPDGDENIARFPDRELAARALPQGDDPEGEEHEYLVDIDTHHSVLVVAHDVEEAAAKALHDEADDMRTTIVGHDVHVCVHSGISDNECDHEDGAKHDG